LLTSACAQQDLVDPWAPQVVPAIDPAIGPGRGVAARYWAHFDPRMGQWDLYRIHPGNVIFPGEVNALPPADGESIDALVTALSYDYGSTATTVDNTTCAAPPLGTGCVANTVHLFSDQTLVTYVEDSQGINMDDGNPADDDCYRNGAFLDNDPTCGGLYASATHPCRANGTFCAPVRMISNFANPLPNPILDIDEVPTTPRIIGCRDDAASDLGTCAIDGSAKITGGTSDFVPSIALLRQRRPRPDQRPHRPEGRHREEHVEHRARREHRHRGHTVLHQRRGLRQR
jgi:hypothetical protein